MIITITPSKDQDLKQILDWLKRECKADADGKGFYHSRNLIREGHREGKLRVLRENKETVAFQLESNILEVRPDKRGKGYGRTLAGLWIESCRAQGEVFLFIECAPSTSLSFWETMGFKEIETPLRGVRAYRILNKRYKLDRDAEQVDVEISFYPEQGDYSKPLSVYRPEAVEDGGQIKLGERVIGVQFYGESDLMVNIQVEGKTLYFDKAKYPEAKALGIYEHHGETFGRGFYCDYILPSGALAASMAEALPPA